MAVVNVLNRKNEHLKQRKQVSLLFLTESNDIEDVGCGGKGLLKKYTSFDEEEANKEDECMSLLPKKFSDSLQSVRPKNAVDPTCFTIRILFALSVIFLLPFILWDGYPTTRGLIPHLKHVEIVWSSLLHVSTWPVVVITLFLAATCPMREFIILPACLSIPLQSLSFHCTSSPSSYHWKIPFALSVLISSAITGHLFLQMAYPSLLWNPFMWGWYRVYLPRDISKSLQNACFFDRRGDRDSVSSSFCLSEGQWKELSSGSLSSHNPDDVATVKRGLDYLQNRSGGLVINALARNVADSIPALRQNIEGLIPLMNNHIQNQQQKLALVVFENDSVDGTREAFQQWAKEETEGQARYTIDLISCGEKNPNCKLDVIDRYDVIPSFMNRTASGVGKLGEFRQIVLDYIMTSPQYVNYSHMIVLDVDLGTSLSPLGLLHTLGLDHELSQKYAIASSSRQVWPGTFGTILPPYDLSAFRPVPTEKNTRLRKWHQWFCELMPPGDRWRNMCEAASPMQLFLILSNGDAVLNHGWLPYEVESAFNGLTIYPLSLIREKGDAAHYDSGNDNQRCEHVGFHLSLRKTMYINPKWTMNLKPSKPGGPSVISLIMLSNCSFLLAFVMAIWLLGFSLRTILSLVDPWDFVGGVWKGLERHWSRGNENLQ